MKRFVFRLETKLRLTGQEEKQALWEYKNRQYRLQQELDSLKHWQDRLAGVWQHLRGFTGVKTGINEIVMVQEFIPVLREGIKHQEKKVTEARERLQEAETHYFAIRTERRMLEKLKEREYQAYLLEWQRQEQKVIDEIATQNAVRKTMI